MDELRVAVQGFGNVGSFLARFLAQEGATVVAVSDSRSGLYNPNGLDVAAAVAHKGETGAPKGCAARMQSRTRSCCSSTATPAPCALGEAGFPENADRVKASIVLEGANGPITPTPRTRSSKTGACWSCPTSSPTPAGSSSLLRGVQGLQEYFWKIDEVNAKLNDITTRAFRETWDLREARGTTMRLAAYGLAVQRVGEATTTRGLYP